MAKIKKQIRKPVTNKHRRNKTKAKRPDSGISVGSTVKVYGCGTNDNELHNGCQGTVIGIEHLASTCMKPVTLYQVEGALGIDCFHPRQLELVK